MRPRPDTPIALAVSTAGTVHACYVTDASATAAFSFCGRSVVLDRPPLEVFEPWDVECLVCARSDAFGICGAVATCGGSRP